MEFRTLEVFRAVATLRSFARAAEALRMTQSAVSQRILNLEGEIGDRLLDRTLKGAALTPKGHLMLSYAERLLAQRDELIEAMAEARTVRRMIRLGVSETIAQTWLPTFIGAVSEKYPLITFEIDVDVTPNLRARLLTQEIDLVFLLGKVIEPGIDNVELCSYPLCFAASTKLKFERTPVSAEQMSRHPLITFPRSTPIYSALQQVFQESAIRLPQIHCSSSVSTIIKMTLDNRGISVLAPFLIEAELQAGKLTILDTTISLPMLDYSASYRVAPGMQMVATIGRMANMVATDYAQSHKLGR
ncbi:MAG: LysR family transcriptional regulator [Bradyrhizobium sp.]|nr:LysR family transcriptional regulator [Bradyrhizobium sp.]